MCAPSRVSSDSAPCPTSPHWGGQSTSNMGAGGGAGRGITYLWEYRKSVYTDNLLKINWSKNVLFMVFFELDSTSLIFNGFLVSEISAMWDLSEFWQIGGYPTMGNPVIVINFPG